LIETISQSLSRERSISNQSVGCEWVGGWEWWESVSLCILRVVSTHVRLGSGWQVSELFTRASKVCAVCASVERFSVVGLPALLALRFWCATIGCDDSTGLLDTFQSVATLTPLFKQGVDTRGFEKLANSTEPHSLVSECNHRPCSTRKCSQTDKVDGPHSTCLGGRKKNLKNPANHHHHRLKFMCM
jgi:hypothetical protein